MQRRPIGTRIFGDAVVNEEVICLERTKDVKRRFEMALSVMPGNRVQTDNEYAEGTRWWRWPGLVWGWKKRWKMWGRIRSCVGAFPPLPELCLVIGDSGIAIGDELENRFRSTTDRNEACIDDHRLQKERSCPYLVFNGISFVFFWMFFLYVHADGRTLFLRCEDASNNLKPSFALRQENSRRVANESS